MEITFLEQICDRMPLGVVLMNRHGEVVFFNRYEQKLAGRSQERVLGRNFFTEVAPCTQSSDLAEEFAANVDAGTLSSKLMFRFARPHIPRPRDVSLILTSIQVGAEAMGALFVQDISSIRSVEHTKDVLVRALSHDMNNPLAALMLQLDLAQSALDEPGAESVESVAAGLMAAGTASHRLRDMIKNLYDVTRLESGAIPIEYQATPMNDLLRRVAEGMSGIAGRRGVRIVTEVDTEDAEIEADSDLIVRVVENLLENAIRFSPSGGRVTLTLRAIADDLRVEVRDDGPGIPEEIRARIFQPFVRDLQQPREERPGTHRGLGLALADLIVREHGGRVAVDCPPEGGSVFSLILPRAQPRFATAQEEAIERNRRRAGGGLDGFLLGG